MWTPKNTPKLADICVHCATPVENVQYLLLLLAVNTKMLLQLFSQGIFTPYTKFYYSIIPFTRF